MKYIRSLVKYNRAEIYDFSATFVSEPNQVIQLRVEYGTCYVKRDEVLRKVPQKKSIQQRVSLAVRQKNSFHRISIRKC